jgi:hypothetical protein
MTFCLTNSIRVGFILWSKPNSPCSSHHCEERREKCAISSELIVLKLELAGGAEDDILEEADAADDCMGLLPRCSVAPAEDVEASGDSAGSDLHQLDGFSRRADMVEEERRPAAQVTERRAVREEEAVDMMVEQQL